MADKEGISSIISISLSIIERHEKEYKMVLLNNSELRDSIMEIKIELQSFEIVYNISNNEDLKRSIYEVSGNVMQELESLSGRTIEEGLDQDLVDAYYNVDKQIDNAVMDPETEQCGIIFQITFFKTSFDFVLKSLRKLSNCKADRNDLSIKEKLLLLHDLLAYIGDTVEDLTIENQERLDPLWDSVNKAACLLYSRLVGQKEESMELEMMHNLSNYVKEIYVAFFINSNVQGFMEESFKGQIYLLVSVMRVLDCTSSSRIDLKDVCEKLHDKLKFLEMFLADLSHEVIIENLIHFAPFIENMMVAALHIFYLFFDKDMKEDLFIEVNGVLADLIHQIEDIQAEVEEIKVYNIPKSDVDEIMLLNYPKTDPLGFLDFFLGYVGELLNSQPKLIKFLKNEIETLKDEFDSLRSLLKQIMELEEYENVRAKIIQLAYQAEHVIDCYLVKRFSNRCIKFTLSKIVEKLKIIQSEVTRINGERKHVTHADTIDKTFNNVPSQGIPLAIDEVVGFEDEAEKIMDFLVRGTNKRDVISIVGLPGLGKTTLTRKLFEDPLVSERFDVRAWCTVSQTYRKRDVLLTILRHIETYEESETLNDEDLVVKLYKSLKGRRYLIVIDDLWNIEDWNDLSRPFPDDKNQSRIIVTSRLHNVASQTNVDSKLHLLREFTDSESWELFKKKLFQNNLFNEGNFSKHFQEVGIKIVKSCKGLPLAIVVIASFLSKQEKNVDKWNEVATNLMSRIFSESESQCKAIFELSYNNLPDQLKSCFLYLGVFEEDEEILLSKLKRVWIAEGFVRETDAKNLEDLVEENCMDLISRSLLTPVEERSRGGVKYCRVHDLVHEFCLKKAEEENFLQVIYTDDELQFSSIYDHRRLIINSDLGQFIKATPFGWRSVRSLFNNSTRDEDYSKIMSLLCKNLKLLRVLDLGHDVDIKWDISGLETLIHLRYLHINIILIDSIPSSISNLWNLQFLRLYGLKLTIPDSLWDMVHLRYVHITPYASFEVHPRRLSNSILLDDLHTLARPRLCYGKDAENLLRKLPNLQKLSCMFYIEDDTTELPRYPVLDFLDQLTSLMVWFDFSRLLQQHKHIKLNFPSNLKKVKLSRFWGYWDDISEMGRILPNLEVLKLGFTDTMDDTWVVKDGDFSKLKYLKLVWCSFKEWIASEYSFPVLEKLVLKDCRKLKEIPSNIGELATLIMISVDYCKKSLCDSVREVKKNQEEYGNSDLKVYIAHPIADHDADTERNTGEVEEDEELEEDEQDEENEKSNTEEH